VLERRRGAGRFAIDTHDREFLAWTANPRGIGGIAVRDLMLLAIERRFGTLATPQPMEWPADHDSCFAARETLAFAHALGLVPRFTPVRSPESNGIAKAFVKTFNEMHPHRALGMRSPRQLLRAHQPPPARSDGATPPAYETFVTGQPP
jgi:putative transposase